MERLESPEKMHRHREALFHGELASKRDAIEQIEEVAVGEHNCRIENIYGAGEHPLRSRLRDSVAFYLKHHPNVRLSGGQIASYLHCTEEEALECIQRAEIELVQHSGSATSADLMVIGQNVGVVVSQLVKTFA